jgi:hypothetical protein
VFWVEHVRCVDECGVPHNGERVCGWNTYGLFTAAGLSEWEKRVWAGTGLSGRRSYFDEQVVSRTAVSKTAVLCTIICCAWGKWSGSRP